MPLLRPPIKVPLLRPQRDPGLEYLESQRSWAHRIAYDSFRIDQFYKAVAKYPAAFPKVKEYPLADTVSLTPDFSRLNRSFLEVLSSRCTKRSAGRRALNLVDLSTLLLASYGQQSHLTGKEDPQLPSRRTTPSPGGLCASEIYYASIRTDGLDNGVYHFRPDTAVLERLPWELKEEQIRTLFNFTEDFHDHEQISGGIFVTSVFDRLRLKYGNRYLRFSILEAGCICQNLDLVSTALGIHHWPHGSVEELALRQVLHIDGIEEAVIHMAAIVGISP